MFKNPWENEESQNIIIEISDKRRVAHINGKTGFFFDTNILINGNKIPLDSINYNNPLNISEHKKYEILFKYKLDDNEVVVRLTEQFNNNLLDFLSGGRRENECCMDFINAIYFGCSAVPLNTISLDEELLTVTSSETLQAGQVISIGNGKDEDYVPDHFTLYLGDDLCLSVVGTNRPLLITTLDQMKFCYSCQETVIVYPIAEDLTIEAIKTINI